MHLAEGYINKIQGRYDANNDAHKVTWADAELSYALEICIKEIKRLAARVEHLEAQLQESKTP